MPSIKINRAIKSLKNYVPSARDPHIDALEQSGLVDTLTAGQLATVIRLMQQAYQNGKSHAGAEKIDNETVWIDDVGGIERQADGSYKLTMPDKGVDKSHAAAVLGSLTSRHKAETSAANGKLGGRPSLRTKAEARVDASSKLSIYKSTIMYDWPEGNEHWHWVLDATESEIIDWAATVQ